jgi:hypothetical protein
MRNRLPQIAMLALLIAINPMSVLSAQQVTGMLGDPTYTYITTRNGVEVSWGVKKDSKSSASAIAVLKIKNTTTSKLEVTYRPTFSCSDGSTKVDDGGMDDLPPLATHSGEMSGLWFVPCPNGAPVRIQLSLQVHDRAAEQLAAREAESRQQLADQQAQFAAERRRSAEQAAAQAQRDAQQRAQEAEQQYRDKVSAITSKYTANIERLEASKNAINNMLDQVSALIQKRAAEDQIERERQRQNEEIREARQEAEEARREANEARDAARMERMDPPPRYESRSTTETSVPSAWSATLTGLRFFESAGPVTPMEARHYATSFESRSTRYINVEAHYDHEPPGQPVRLSVACTYTNDAGLVMGTVDLSGQIAATWRGSYSTGGWGWQAAGKWEAGEYHVACLSNGRQIGESRFTIVPPSGWKATPTGLRFFESGNNGIPLNERRYATTFNRNSTRFVFVEADFSHEAPARRVPLSISCTFIGPDGAVFGTTDLSYVIQPTWEGSSNANGRGWEEPGHWPPGKYRVTCSSGDRTVGAGRFTVSGPAVVLSPVRQTSPDPTNTVRGPDGVLRPAPGFEWARNGPSVFSVQPVAPPNTIRRSDGTFVPAPGYEWAHPEIESDHSVRPARSSSEPTPQPADSETAQHVDAVKRLRRAIEIDPTNEGYKARLRNELLLCGGACR